MPIVLFSCQTLYLLLIRKYCSFSQQSGVLLEYLIPADFFSTVFGSRFQSLSLLLRGLNLLISLAATWSIFRA